MPSGHRIGSHLARRDSRGAPFSSARHARKCRAFHGPGGDLEKSLPRDSSRRRAEGSVSECLLYPRAHAGDHGGASPHRPGNWSPSSCPISACTRARQYHDRRRRWPRTSAPAFTRADAFQAANTRADAGSSHVRQSSGTRKEVLIQHLPGIGSTRKPGTRSPIRCIFSHSSDGRCRARPWPGPETP